MRRPRRILNVVLVFALVLNGAAGAHAASPAEQMLNLGDPVTSGEAAPCHGDSTAPESSPDSEPSKPAPPDCCDDACVCSIATSFVASIGIVASDVPAPEHRDSSSDLTYGHASAALNLLLRPPNS